MMEYNFTERLRKVLALAKKEASQFQHPSVEPLHILLALLKEDGGIAHSVLKEFVVDLNAIRRNVELLLRDANIQNGGDRGAYSLDVRKVLEFAMTEARELESASIGTEHLLLGLLRYGGSAADLLANQGVTLSEVRKILQGKDGQPPEKESIGPSTSANNSKTASERPSGKSRKTPALNTFARDLTELAAMGKLDPVIGRTHEVERVIEILSRKKKNNPILVGEPGVGKTAIVEALAQMIVAELVPEHLRDVRLFSLDMGAVLAGTKYRGQFEERIQAILNEVRTASNIILFIDEIHTVTGAGASEGAITGANLLKPALARGELRCIGATTLEEYRKYIEKDGALERRFQVVSVEPPSTETTVDILKGIKGQYEEFHGVVISDEAIESAVKLSERYINDRFLPDKAIDVLDEACARLRLRRRTESPEIKSLYAELEKVVADKMNAIQRQQFERAAELRDQERLLKKEIQRKKEEWEISVRKQRVELGRDDVAYVVSRWTGVPIQQVGINLSHQLLSMEASLKERIVGQDDAITTVIRAIKRNMAGLRDSRRPIGSFVFAGPTGVGKTMLAREIAEHLFGSKDALVRIDMSEHMEKHSVSALIGAPPGYVGYDTPGRLTEAIRRKPYSVVLFDEIEKAHPDVFNLLLQILEDGRLTDSHGRVVDFKNTLIIMTSNLGANSLKHRKVGFDVDINRDAYARMHEAVNDELEKVFSPELRNRLDDVIVFAPLQMNDACTIVLRLLEELKARIGEQGIALEFSERAVRWLAEKGYDAKLGARPLRRTVERQVEDMLADMLLSGDIRAGDRLCVELSDGPEPSLDFQKLKAQSMAAAA